MNKFSKIIIAILVLLVLAEAFFLWITYYKDGEGNDPSKPENQVTDIVKVERVFYHEHSNFSFLYLDKDKGVHSFSPCWDTDCWGVKWRVIADLKPEESLNAVLTKNKKSGSILAVDIHIHSAQEIGGGGWNHGKNGSGQTSLIE